MKKTLSDTLETWKIARLQGRKAAAEEILKLALHHKNLYDHHKDSEEIMDAFDGFIFDFKKKFGVE